MKFQITGTAVLAVFVATHGTMFAQTVFTESFNSPTGQNQNANQVTTNLPVAFGGNFSGWTASGDGSAHLVDRGGANSWALMLYQGGAVNILTSATIPGGNFAGRPYAVSFDIAPAAYNGISQATDEGQAPNTDGVYLEVLDSTNTVMGIQLFHPGSFSAQASAGSLPFAPVSMNYVGTGVGTGDITVRLSANNAGSARFGGAVDNLAVTSGALFVEDFDTTTGQTYNATQATTGLPVAFGGNLANWTESGAGMTHVVDRGTGNQAAMFYNGTAPGTMNQLQSVAIPGGNVLGQQYQLAFELAPGSYSDLSQATTATDAMIVQMIDSTNAVVATGTYSPGEFSLSATAGNLAFAPIVFNYTGNGLGDGSISIRLLPNFEGSNVFAGSVDNLMLSLVPEPSGLATLALGAIGFIYILRRRRRFATGDGPPLQAC